MHELDYPKEKVDLPRTAIAPGQRHSLLEPASGQGAHDNRRRSCRRRAGPGLAARALSGCATTPAHRLAGDRRSHRRFR
jgi:hypothetical protein